MTRLVGISRRAIGVIVAGVVLSACSPGGDDGAGPGGAGRDGADGGQAIAFTVTEVHVQSMAATPPAFPDDVGRAVVATLDTYLDRGIVQPLRTDKPPTGVEELFTPAALARATAGADKAAVLETGGGVPGRLTRDRADTAFTVLTDGGGAPLLVNARLEVSLTFQAGDDRVRVARSGDMVLVPDGGTWRIDAYDLRTTRDTLAAGAE